MRVPFFLTTHSKRSANAIEVDFTEEPPDADKMAHLCKSTKDADNLAHPCKSTKRDPNLRGRGIADGSLKRNVFAIDLFHECVDGN